MDKIMKKKKGLEPVTSLYLSCKVYLEKFHFGMTPWIWKPWKGKEKKWQNIEYLKSKESFLGKIKTIFHNFLKTFFW